MNNQPAHVPPKYDEDAFSCPFCNAYANMRWTRVYAENWGVRPYMICRCDRCLKETLWATEEHETDEELITVGHIISPPTSTAAQPHPDLPETCVSDYSEAQDIVDRSPRGAAALLRLCLEKLCAQLTGKNQGINDNIKDLVANGLPVMAQQSLDYLRVIGNHAVHPGQIDLQDTPEMVHAMFGLINFIVDQQITQPKTIEALYNQIPAGAREAIERRDTPK